MPHFEERFKKLNAQQKQAVEAIDGPVLVIAGPGSGKTEILSLRVANILKKTDTHPSSILCLTFTDSAAVNMRTRLAGLIGRDAYRVVINTFHSFSADIIGRYPEYFYEGASFSPADELTQIEILETIFKELPHDNPLRKEHPEQGFTYLDSAQRAIGQLKKAGITPDDFTAIIRSNSAVLAAINERIGIFEARLSMKQLPSLREFAVWCASLTQELPIKGYVPLGHALVRSLTDALNRAENEDKTAPISAWKTEWVKKDENGARVFKNTLYQDKLLALAGVYQEYIARMHARGYYDFDDMLLDVLSALKHNNALRYELQERYQYILVDEFQDTNDAQMRLLEFLTDAEAHEGKPNIMVVGDDDQAVYKFQGAEISNILEFRGRFENPAIITLTHNYRSRQDILDLARHVILKGTERLERLVEGLRKDLVAAGKDMEEGKITSRSFPSHAHECHWIAQEIKKLIAGGKNPDDIAIIARQHKDLQSILSHLSALGIPVAYERQRNVLLEPHIYQLIQIARFICTLSRKNKSEADEYLPEILSFPFWGLDRKTIWELSAAATAKTPWLGVMLNHTDARFRTIACFFLDLATRAQHEPAEYVLDAIIGSHEPSAHPSFVSPFRAYYFNAEKFEHHKAEYLAFLSALQVFVSALREYKHGRYIKIDDLVAFVDMHAKNNIPITDQSAFMAAQNAVHCLSAHKAKGLEFDTVFVMSCQDSVWAGSPRGSMLPFPANLPIAPAGDTLDDQLRLFYVALTRAKHGLYLTSYEKTDTGKDSLRLRFLTPEADGEIKESVRAALMAESVHDDELPEPTAILSAHWEQYNRAPFLTDEKALLGTLVENYQMSVTHINNFLDVVGGGPQMFLEQNLLRFPHAKSPSGSYGSAMHKAIELLYAHFKHEKTLPSTEQLILWFTYALEKERLAPEDFTMYSEKGTDALAKFYAAKKEQWRESDMIEMNFKNQGVLVGDAHLTGKLDKMVFLENTREIEVHDFKTGNPADEWEGEGVYEKKKLYGYKRQLVFYKLLVEHSRDFGGKYTVNKGVVEFLEPYRGKMIDLPLVITQKEVERTRALINAVYKKIVALDFPDVSKYSKDVNGIIAFEDDLLREAGAIHVTDSML
ncbi:ATP-dependent helicase [Candidatus Azambacteria bacterium]|nr:ATP-dependent helicase [Candidatus Azambacteria bacterium]